VGICCADHATPSIRSVDIVRSWTKATEFSLLVLMISFTPLHSLGEAFLIMQDLATMFYGYKIRTKTLMSWRGNVCSLRMEGIHILIQETFLWPSDCCNVWVLDRIHNQILPPGSNRVLRNFSECNCLWIRSAAECHVGKYRHFL
jgi:hypothetical protein